MIAAGHRFSVPRERVVRKLQSLHALGHTADDIGAEIGISGQAVRQFMTLSTPCLAAIAERYDEAFRALEMRLPPDDIWHRRTKNRAAKQGWRPPLAWEDIDAGVLADAPTTGRAFSRDRFDEDLIDYVMQYHDFSERLSPVEKSEIVRRWTRSVGSEASLCRLTGWREGRYRVPRPTTHQEVPA